MVTQSYKFSRGFFLNNFLHVWFVCNQRDKVPLFRHINQSDEVSHLFRGMKVLGDMEYLMRSVKLAVEAVVICAAF